MKCLLEAVKASGVDCIIVKDFSRFARDYIETGSYIEQIFPFMGVRFISVNDHYDSVEDKEHAARMDVNFKNLLYDLYSKDLSQKVRTALSVRKAEGAYVSACVPFGYRKAPEDRHMLLIEPAEAEIVRRIFDLAGMGMSSVQIAECFNKEGVRTPLAFQLERGQTTRKPKGGIFLWSASFISQLLCNPVYVGDIQYGKYEQEAVGGRSRLKPRREWKVIHDHHAAIVDREVFETVCNSRICHSGRKQRRGYDCHLLVGILVCGGCKRNLRYHAGVTPYYYCCQRKEGAGIHCVSRIRADELEIRAMLCLEEHLIQHGEWEYCIREYREEIRGELQEKKEEMRKLNQTCIRRRQEHIREYQCYTEGKTEKYISGTGELQILKEACMVLEEEILRLEEKLARLDGIAERREIRDSSVEELRQSLLRRVFPCYVRRMTVLEGDFQIEWMEQPELLHLPDRRGD